MELKLSKIVPKRTKIVRFNWAWKDWMQCNDRYRAIRGKLRRSSMLKCDWCGHKFQDGEWFGLAQPVAGQEGPKRNWVLCHTCADLMDAPSRKDNQKIHPTEKRG